MKAIFLVLFMFVSLPCYAYECQIELDNGSKVDAVSTYFEKIPVTVDGAPMTFKHTDLGKIVFRDVNLEKSRKFKTEKSNKTCWNLQYDVDLYLKNGKKVKAILSHSLYSMYFARVKNPYTEEISEKDTIFRVLMTKDGGSCDIYDPNATGTIKSIIFK